MTTKIKLGATGKFPQGKLKEGDEGELQLTVTHHKGNVLIDFGKPVAWLGLPPDVARNLAKLFIQHADAIDGGDNEI